MEDAAVDAARVPLWRGLIKLARPAQWSKSAFVAVGPAYWLVDHAPDDAARFAANVLLACVAFALASSGCYVFNDLADVEEDRRHPRKCRRPIASGVVPVPVAKWYALGLFVAAGVLVLLIGAETAWLCGVLLAAYVANVMAYSAGLKRVVIADVMSLSMGFVLRVFGGCAAIGIAPTTWLLNVVLFLSMTLAFGKRLGERRSMGGDASSIRGVQQQYSDDLLRMALVVTAVGTLLTYAGYVTTREADFTWYGFNWLWLSLLPATYGLLRAILLLEHGKYDDPTDLAVSDRPFQASALLFGVLMIALWLVRRG
ncbi:MAG: UbiA prenyltransferase family protein [Phycisphaeraceae bacterium]|nr:MAG: UbiA prenyltransferase family protein [Phycisphaeraceae bacterium]